jgi:TPR repeat protein
MLELYENDPDDSDAFFIAECYKDHVKNNTEAIIWYRKAADQGDESAVEILRNCYGIT